MRKKVLLIITLIALSIPSFGQEKIDPDLEIMTFLGRVPQKTESNVLPDNLLRILYYNIKPADHPEIGYMNLQGEILVEPAFNMGSDFYGETANVIKDSIYGYINKQGEEKFFSQYDETFFYYSDTGIAKQDGEYALINRNGELLTDFKYVMINFFGHNFFQGFIIDENSEILNETGKIIFNEDKNFKIQSDYIDSDSLIVYQQTINGKELTGLVNLDGKIVLKPTYDEIHFLSDDRFMAVQADTSWGYVDKTGNVKIPVDYEEVAFNITDDLIPVKKNGKWGYVNRENEVQIPFLYDNAHAFVEGLAFVKKEGLYGSINKQNEVKIDFKLEETAFPFFSDGLALFKNNEKYGFINKEGEVVISAIYDRAYPFFEERANVELDGKAGQINTSGEEVIPIRYKQLWLQSEDIIRFAN